MIEGRFNYPSDYRIGAGCVAELPAASRDRGIARPLLVTDPGILTLPWYPGLEARLREAGLALEVFSDIDANPSSEHVAAGVERGRDHRADGVILLGGGSAMDAGKSIALLIENPGGILDYEDVRGDWTRANPDTIRPSIAIPTTAGTGSEVGRAAVIVDPRDHGKKVVFHPRMQPDAVLADPELTLGLPPGLTAATGMDALAHCFEAYCAPAYHPMADGIALEGMRLIAENLAVVVDDGENVESRTHMLMAASMGATAFQKGLGLIHALSHPVGGVTGLHHGTANAIFQPFVMVHNRSAIEARMPRLAAALELDARSPAAAFDAVLEWTVALIARIGLPANLADFVAEEQIAMLVPMAAADPSLATNPKPCSAADLERVLRKAIAGDLSP